MEPPTLPSYAPSKDEEQLRLLVIFHYVVAALGALCACFPLIHVGMGLMIVLNPDFMTGGQKSPPPPPALGYLFIVIGAVFVLAGWAAAICTLISGRMLAQRRRRMFSFVIAALLCAFVPFGTVLGIFTIIILSRESVQRLFEQGPTKR